MCPRINLQFEAVPDLISNTSTWPPVRAETWPSVHVVSVPGIAVFGNLSTAEGVEQPHPAPAGEMHPELQLPGWDLAWPRGRPGQKKGTRQQEEPAKQ